MFPDFIHFHTSQCQLKQKKRLCRDVFTKNESGFLAAGFFSMFSEENRKVSGDSLVLMESGEAFKVISNGYFLI